MKKITFILLYLLSTPTFSWWGGDLVYLSKILQQSIYQLEQLRQITGVGEETLNILRETNRGVHEAIYIKDSINRTLKAGTFSKLKNLNETINTVKNLYGRIPKTSQSELQKKNDLTVAENFQHHNEVYKYAKNTDEIAQRIKHYSHKASYVGATKTLLEGQAVIIHTLNQILRTNASLLKIQSQMLALYNKNQKINSRQFQVQYSELGNAFKNLNYNYNLAYF